ncbi:hypothetical protein [Streptosporangium vulgare]|uniref:Uncharacterized protein n=1 Tax=Streptosporangium vulgare TaxID=46190 RepID=A0ABV5TR33_9ACTN
MITIDDFVMLGKTVPEPNSDGRVFVCSAGVSETMRSLIRIYPLARYGAPARWSINQVALEVNPKDSRKESFRLAGDRTPEAHEQINNTFRDLGKVPQGKRAALLKRHTVGSIKEANDKKISLAIINPDVLDLTFEFNPESPDSPQQALFDMGARPEAGAKRFAYIPRLRFKDEDGQHHLMLRDWGCFEYMRKHGDDKRSDLAGGLHLHNSRSLLIGNFNRHRNSWLVISVLGGLRQPASLFDEIPENSDHLAAALA